jgi:hypothetical protein
MFMPPDLPPPPRMRPRRTRTTPAPNETDGREEQEAIDEVLARQLQEQQLDEDLQMMNHLRLEPDAEHVEDPALQARQRAARRARRRVYAVTEQNDIVEYNPAMVQPEIVEGNSETFEEDPDAPEPGTEATIAGLRPLGESRVESWRRHI